jgi:hypothetical protein
VLADVPVNVEPIRGFEASFVAVADASISSNALPAGTVCP